MASSKYNGQNSQQGLYTIKSIAEFTGFNPNLLRAWERRYDLLEPQRKASGHRLYTEEDRRVLMAVRSHMAQGRSIGEIAILGRQDLLAYNGLSRPEEPTQVCQEDEPCPPQVSRLLEQMVEAALRLDAEALESLLDESFAILDRETVFQSLMVKAIRRIGDLWGQGRASVANERMASELFCRRIYQWWGAVQRNTGDGPSVLIACLPDEQHEMGALLVTYHLVSEGANVRYLGSLPLLDLELACQKLNPKLTLLSVTRPELFSVHRDRLTEVIARNKSTRFILGGSGVDGNKGEVARMGAELWSSQEPLAKLSALLED